MDDQIDRGDRRSELWPRTRQRQRVLEMVREHCGPVDAAELAGRMGLHVTTVRFHLDALCDDETIERTRMQRSGVGRPRTGYVAVRGRLDYQSLAEILALELGDTAVERQRRAERAGRRWADRVAASLPTEAIAQHDVSTIVEPSELLNRRAATTAEIFGRMGFGPELIPAATSRAGKRQRTILLHACPVRDLARAHPEVSCAMHRGLLQGLLTNVAATENAAKKSPRPAVRAELEPFVESELCVAKVINGD